MNAIWLHIAVVYLQIGLHHICQCLLFPLTAQLTIKNGHAIANNVNTGLT